MKILSPEQIRIFNAAVEIYSRKDITPARAVQMAIQIEDTGTPIVLTVETKPRKRK